MKIKPGKYLDRKPLLSYIVITIIALLLIGIIGGLCVTKILKTSKLQSANDAFFNLFKSRCEVFDEGSYQDQTFSFNIAFADDQIVCLLKDDIGQNHEVYLWQKNIFKSASIDVPLQDAILGKITVDPAPGMPALDVIGGFSTMIDDEFVEGEIVTSKNCNSDVCPHAKRVMIERNGKLFSIEEYNERLSLFENIHFNLGE